MVDGHIGAHGPRVLKRAPPDTKVARDRVQIRYLSMAGLRVLGAAQRTKLATPTTAPVSYMSR